MMSLAAVFASACTHGNESAKSTALASTGAGIASAAGEIVKPPFRVAHELDGLLLVWFDEAGVHSAQKRGDIPEAARAHVRVDSLNIDPEKRLDSSFVYVADVRAESSDGEYIVRKMSRDAFDALLENAKAPTVAAAAADDENAKPAPTVSGKPGAARVIIYGASWCGACHQAAAFLRSHNIPFVEHDIEREPEARAEMQRKCTAAGLHPTGIPVIDVGGHIMLGFEPNQLQHLLNSP